MNIPLANILAPHYCCFCGKVGYSLCHSCEYNITSEVYEACILCRKLSRPADNLCSGCPATFTKAWCVGDRQGGLKQLINSLKFERMRGAHQPLGELLAHTLPHLPSDVCVVPVPTISGHIRLRGYDQTHLIASHLAKKRGLRYRPALRRATNTVQRGATRQQRIAQAKVAFVAKQNVTDRYLVVDDISTTGATLQYAAQALLDAGASEVWVAVVACQPLEKD